MAQSFGRFGNTVPASLTSLRWFFFMLASILSQFSSFTFSGSRSCGVAAGEAASFVSLLPAGASVSVGCAQGVDSVVRSSAPARGLGLSVFAVQGSGRWAFAYRSARLVRACLSTGSLFCCFPAGPCPSGVVPSRSFRGFGSGSWGSLALAVGFGCPCLVVVPLGVSVPRWFTSARCRVVAPGVFFFPASLSLF